METFEEIIEPEKLQIIRDIADSIWPETFRTILSGEQIRYMMKMMYAPEVMEKEMAEGHHFEILRVDGEPAGYMVWSPWQEEAGHAKLHKLYLLSRFHHQGFGRAMLEHVAERCRASGFTHLVLAVNKQNRQAYRVYERNGFEVFRSVKIDIGNGFYMDDYWMKRSLQQ